MKPVLIFDVAGNTQSNLIITGVYGLISQGYSPVAALVFFGAIARRSANKAIDRRIGRRSAMLNFDKKAAPQQMPVRTSEKIDGLFKYAWKLIRVRKKNKATARSAVARPECARMSGQNT